MSESHYYYHYHYYVLWLISKMYLHLPGNKTDSIILGAPSRENLSLGFSIMSVSNGSTHLQRLASVLILDLERRDIYYPCSKRQRC